MCVERAKRWKGVLQTVDDELVEALRSRQVLQPVRPEVPERQPCFEVSADQAPSRLRDEHLAPVRGADDSRRMMHVEADIFVPDKGRFASMQAHANSEVVAAFPGVAGE